MSLVPIERSDPVDVAGVRDRSLERTNVLIRIDPDDQAANGAAVRVLQVQRGGGKTVGTAIKSEVRGRKSWSSGTRMAGHLGRLLADKLDTPVQRVDIILAETRRVREA